MTIAGNKSYLLKKGVQDRDLNPLVSTLCQINHTFKSSFSLYSVQLTSLLVALYEHVPVYAPVPVSEQAVILPAASKVQVKLPPPGTQLVLRVHVAFPPVRVRAYSAAQALTQFLTSDWQADFAAADLYLANWGIAIAAKIAMIATTINNSTRVKPL